MNVNQLILRLIDMKNKNKEVRIEDDHGNGGWVVGIDSKNNIIVTIDKPKAKFVTPQRGVNQLDNIETRGRSLLDELLEGPIPF